MFTYFRKGDHLGKKERERETWMDNIKIYFRETRLEGVDWIQLAQDRFQ
jgi:hypothetical protein